MVNNLNGHSNPIIIITGFGPFYQFPVNASWEGVKIMNREEFQKKHNVQLVLMEIPVNYEKVDEIVPTLWKTYNPMLMVHCGVASGSENFILETKAYKNGYELMDSYGNCPANNECSAPGPIEIDTKLNVEQICKEFNDANIQNAKSVSSKYAGSYLCEYIYYTSLSVDNTRALFIHVPDINTYSSEKTARGLENILELCLKQLH